MKKKYNFMLILFVVIGVLTSLFFVTNVEAKSLKLNRKKMSVYIGSAHQLNVNNNKAGKKVKWSSSNKKIVKVSKKGVIKAKKVGKAVVTAKVGKKKLKCYVTVKHLVSVKKTVTIRGDGYIEAKFPLWKWYGVKYKIQDESLLFSEGWNGWDEKKQTKKLWLYAKKSGTTYVTLTNEFDNEVVKVKVNVIFPKISFPSSPVNISYGSSISIDSKATINSVSSEKIFSWYKVYKTYDIDLILNGIKTYDSHGNFGTSLVCFLVVVYDETGAVAYSSREVISPYTVIVNQKFSCKLSIRDLSWNHSYRVEIYNAVW